MSTTVLRSSYLMTYKICFFIFSVGATIAAVYQTAHFTMPRYASFLWGAGQAFIGFLVSYTRVLATLWSFEILSIYLIIQKLTFPVVLSKSSYMTIYSLTSVCVASEGDDLDCCWMSWLTIQCFFSCSKKGWVSHLSKQFKLNGSDKNSRLPL